jgi:hypothetical protein
MRWQIAFPEAGTLGIFSIGKNFATTPRVM